MAEASPSPVAPRARSRRRVGRWFLVLVLLVLIGRGLGLAGRAPTPAGGAATAGEPMAAVPAAATPATSPSLAPSSSSHEVADSPPAAPAVESAPANAAAAVVAATPPAATPAPAAIGYDADRFASLASVVAFHTERGEFGTALTTMQHLRGLPLDGAQRMALLPAGTALDTALAAACAHLLEQLCSGHALAAHEQLARWFADGEVAMAPWLDSALQAAGLPGGLFRGLAGSDTIVPTARPFARGCLVRIKAPSHRGTGTVVDSRTDQVTVRLQTPAGWSFPTVPAIACEVVQPDADDAIEAGLRAAHAGSPLLARVWLAIARLRRPEGLGARGQQLARLLP